MQSEWGIGPVPVTARRLGFWDYFVLWGDLGVGLLVLLAGTLLVPALSLPQAVLAILVGSLVGCLLLALAGVVGSETGVPSMVLLRPVLGIRGSYLATVLNIVQLIGWGAFEIIVMARAADGLSRALIGASNFRLWVLVFGLLSIAMALGGPILIVRQWLEKFAVWLVLLTTGWLFYYLLTRAGVASLWTVPGKGGLSFWAGVDLVVAMPVSWLPLVGDYSRFARSAAGAFWGTSAGYFLANVAFYGLGALLVLGLMADDLIGAIMAGAGWIGLFIILVDETDEAFADIYSAAVSGQNILTGVGQRTLALVVGALCLVLAGTIPVMQYENFLLAIGSVFVPLFGVLAADYFWLRGGRYEAGEIFRAGGRYWYAAGINWWAIGAWAAGTGVYHLIAHQAAWLGSSLPSFAAAFLLYAFLGRRAVVQP